MNHLGVHHAIRFFAKDDAEDVPPMRFYAVTTGGSQVTVKGGYPSGEVVWVDGAVMART